MIPQEAEKIIREACIKANPSIMELGFGCEIKTKRGAIVTVISTKPFAQDGLRILCKEKEGHACSYSKKTITGILGRPIRLCDVLRAITRHVKYWGEDFTILADGFMSRKGMKTNSEIRWNLLEDSLEKQSPETLIFLGNLLG